MINDMREFLAFVEWLPELEKHECYYLAVFARKKYHASAKNGKTNITRFTATSKEWLIRKVKGISGPYCNKDGSPVHQDSLALYITVNPRSFPKAQANLLKELLNVVLAKVDSKNPAAMAMSEIQKAKSRTCWVDFDIDDSSMTARHLSRTLLRVIGSKGWTLLNTRGGYHILVDPHAMCVPDWHRRIRHAVTVDIVGDNMIPVPGCRQGDFTPNIVVGVSDVS